MLRVVMGYRVQNVREVRQRFRALARDVDTPVLICPNHLTMADSAIVTWALGGSWWYLKHYRWLAWNVPEYRNFASSFLGRVGAWVVKCMPVVRGGPREEVSRVLRRLQYVVSRGEAAMIFAEGGRSRTGRIAAESVAHGLGRVMSGIPDCQVLCVYLRGDHQTSWSTIPVRGESFYVDFELFRPESGETGMRRSRSLATRVADRLAALEEKYFAGRG